MSIDIKPWVKPHLRARLLEEAAAREPAPTEGLTPVVAPVPVYTVVVSTSYYGVGDRVRVAKPHAGVVTPDSPGWRADMDAYVGQELTIVLFYDRTHHPTWFKASDSSGYIDWFFSTAWVVEKL